MADVAIVGGGVIGCAIAYYLTKAGARVTLLERGEIGGQASGAAAGMLIPPAIYLLRENVQLALNQAEAPPAGPLRDLGLASLELYPPLVDALQNETGIDVQYMASGILLVAQTEGWAEALRALGHAQQESGSSIEWVEGEPLRRLEPGLSTALPGAAYSPGQRHVNPGLLTQALARAVRLGQGGEDAGGGAGGLPRQPVPLQQRDAGARFRQVVGGGAADDAAADDGDVRHYNPRTRKTPPMMRTAPVTLTASIGSLAWPMSARWSNRIAPIIWPAISAALVVAMPTRGPANATVHTMSAPASPPRK